MTDNDALYRVTFTFDYATVSTVVAVPWSPDYDSPDYDHDEINEIASEIATDLLYNTHQIDVTGAFGLDVEPLRWVAR